MELIHLGAEHLPGLTTLEQACFPDEPWPADLLAGALEGEGVLAVGLVKGSRLLAAALGRLAADEAELHSISVAPDHRREGLGRRILQDFTGLARCRGARTVWLEVRASNEPAIRLYLDHGFARAGRRPRYYNDGEDALLYCLHLPARPPR